MTGTAGIKPRVSDVVRMSASFPLDIHFTLASIILVLGALEQFWLKFLAFTLLLILFTLPRVGGEYMSANPGLPWQCQSRISSILSRRRKSLGRRLTWLQLLFIPLLASISLVGALEVTVSPNDLNWKVLVQTSTAGTTIHFLPGVYQSCNVTVPAGVTLAANPSTLEANVIIDCANDARHFMIADGVQDVHIVGLSLVNGLARDGLGIVAEGGGCVLMGQNASLFLLNVTFQNCHANYDGSLEPESSGRGGAVFVGAWSTLVLKDSVITDCSSGRHGGGLYSDTHSHLEIHGVVFQSLAAGICLDPLEVCISFDWIDVFGANCDAYAANPLWCGDGESSEMCCACRGGLSSKSCEPTGAGGAYFAASHVSVTVHSVEFRNCSGGLTAGGAHLEHHVSATISNSAFLDCSSTHGAAMMLSGDVSLFLLNVSMHRNHAKGHGGALNAAKGGNTISIHGGTVVNNSAGGQAGGFHVFSSSMDAVNLSVIGNTAAEYGGGIFLEAGICTLSSSSILDNTAEEGGGVYAQFSSIMLQGASDCNGNTARKMGGGMFLLSSSLTALTSRINGNRAGRFGGGLLGRTSSSIMLVASSVSSNTAESTAGGAHLMEASTLIALSSSIHDNTAEIGGGLTAFSSSITLLQGTSVNGNAAGFFGGGVFLQLGGNLTAANSSIDSNVGCAAGGGVMALVFCFVTLTEGSSASSNTAGCATGNIAGRGGGIFLQESSLAVFGSAMDSNAAGITGGGVEGTLLSFITLSHGASASHNTARSGGGIYMQQCALTVASSSSIANNAATDTGGGVVAFFESSMALGDSTSIAHNAAGTCCGGIHLATSSTLTITGRTSICSNSAHGGSGGAILAEKSTILLLGSGDLTLSSNTARYYGGACAIQEASLLIDSEDSSHTHLTVRDNTASGGGMAGFNNGRMGLVNNGNGGGLFVSGDSTVSLGVTVVVISRNVAAQRGGGLFVEGSKQEEATGSSNKAGCSSTEKVVFWRLDLVDNKALAGHGGGLYSASNINLRPGGQTNVTGNTAGEDGGAVALSDATLIVQSGHTVIAQHNEAKKDGGAIALLSGARLSLLEAEPCPSACPQTNRGAKYCEQACMSAECNWHGGNCVLRKMDKAGADALLPCNRTRCQMQYQTNAETTVGGCLNDCFTASCDWSREMCVKPRTNVLGCPLIDAAAFSSVKAAQQHHALTPVFLTDGNSRGGFGRCNSSCHQPVVPTDVSSLLGAGMVGPGSLRLIPGENNKDAADWVHMNTRHASVEESFGLGFTVESWIQVPSACHSEGVDNTFSFVVAGGDYAVALRGMHVPGMHVPHVFVPLFFWTAAPASQCVDGPHVLTASTGSIGDGPGLLSRSQKQGPLSCSWILSPGGGAGGFREVTLIFTEFLLTSRDKLNLYSCSDSNCTAAGRSEVTTLTGSDVPSPFVSTTSVILVILTQRQDTEGWPSSPGFTASYAGTPELSVRLPAGIWHHLSLTVSESGLAALLINGTQQHADELPWDTLPTLNALSAGKHATAIGRGSPAWQDGGEFANFDVGYYDDACIAVDELRFWTSERSATQVSSNMYLGCIDLVDASAQLAGCYSFDQVSNAVGLEDSFADASPNQIPAFAAARGSPYQPWCVNEDDDGKLKLDIDMTSYGSPEMWGYCTLKPRLPGAGYDYSETAMEAANAHRLAGTVAVLQHYPGCGKIPLQLSHNTAQRYGGAIYYSSCLRLDKACFVQGIGPLSSSRAVLLDHNTARAGGAVYVECHDMGICTEVFAETNKLGALPLLPKIEFTGSKSSAYGYGNFLATTPSRLQWHQKDNSSIVLVPGQQPLALSVKLFDSVGLPDGTLVIGSEHVIELLICPVTGVADVCTFSSASIPALNAGFHPDTGFSNIQQAVECAVGDIEMSFQIRVLGAEHIGKITGRISCTHCDAGQRRVLHDARGTWSCETCGPDTYISANPVSQAESGICLACPPSAACVNGAPPIFGASKVTGEIEMELPDASNGDYVIRQALAAKLGVDASIIILLNQDQQRRDMQKVAFELVADTAQMIELVSKLKAMGVVLSGDIESMASPSAEGEAWEQLAGQFILRACPPGNQLINTANGMFNVNAQRCQPCSRNYYITDPNNPSRVCLECPVHARCEAGIFLGGTPEATWEVDSTGEYKLMRCIAGYSYSRFSFSNVSLAEQHCQFCEAGSYCIAGVQQLAQLCPSDTYSDPGSVSSNDCYKSNLVVSSVMLPMQTNEFNRAAKNLFLTALASSAGTFKYRVGITGVTQSGRRRGTLRAQEQPYEIDVQTRISTKSEQEAEQIITQQSDQSLKDAMRKVGLPEGRFKLQPHLIVQTSQTLWTPTIVVVVVGCLIGFTACIFAGGYYWYKSSVSIVSPEEQELRDILVLVRSQLNLTRAHGVFLSSERPTMWERVCWASPLVIERKSLEALAKMRQCQSFERAHVDLLWLFLRDLASTQDHAAYTKSSDPNFQMPKSLSDLNATVRPFILLQLFMMETCRRLLTCTPDGTHLTDSNNPSAVHQSRQCPPRIPSESALLVYAQLRPTATISQGEPEITQDASELSHIDVDNVAANTASVWDSSTVRTTNGSWPTLSKDLLEGSTVEISIIPQNIARVAGGSFGGSTAEGGETKGRFGRSWSLSQNFSGQCTSEFSSAITLNAVGYSDPKFDSKFAFLRDKVMQLRIWYDEDGKFFKMLKTLVQKEMDVFAQRCHERYEQLKKEKGGMELIAYDPPLKHNIWRQDHPEICALRVNTQTPLETEQLAEAISHSTPDSSVAYVEEIFVTQLNIRARTLAVVFSDMVNKVITSHAVFPLSNELDGKYVVRCKFMPQLRSSSNKDQECGGISPVEVLHAPVKRKSRMQQKLLEYTPDRNPEWPITGHILDPVRASVVCKGPQQLLQILGWFLEEEDSPPVCRFKNRYAQDADVQDGYRDVSIYLIVTAPSGLKVIGEVQIHVEDSWILKKQMHKLYQIKRAETADVI